MPGYDDSYGRDFSSPLSGQHVVVHSDIDSDISGKLLTHDCAGVLLMSAGVGVIFIPWHRVSRIAAVNMPVWDAA